jgi:5'-nucleotidase
MAESRPICLVDMDGVMADFEGESINRLRLIVPDLDTSRPLDRFYFKDNFPEFADEICDIHKQSGFFADLPLIDGTLEGWSSLLEWGFDPVVCSSPLSINSTCETEKREWLAEHLAPIFGKSVVSRAVITKYKHLVDGIVLIDDRPEIPHASSASWQHIVFGRVCNIGRPNRIMGWRDSTLKAKVEQAMKSTKSKPL